MKHDLSFIQSYLTAPGSGVYTVFTGRERRQALQKLLYGETDQAAEDIWRQTLAEKLSHNNPAVLGVCSDIGGGINRGANWGPLFVRLALYQQLKHWRPTELGDVRVVPQLLLDEYVSDPLLKNCRKALYGNENAARVVSPLSIAYECAKWFHETHPDRLLLGLGGDHSCSYPLLKAYLEHKKKQGKKAAVIHFDAHTDMMESRLGIPICFGSWTYHILPYLTNPDHLVQIGIRASGRPRQHWESQYGIRQFWAHEVHENGGQAVVDEIIAHLKARNVEEIYITFDIDALDDSHAAATGTPENEGLQLAETKAMIQALGKAFVISGADLMEVAPFISYPDKGKQANEPDNTLKSAVEIIATMVKI